MLLQAASLERGPQELTPLVLLVVESVLLVVELMQPVVELMQPVVESVLPEARSALELQSEQLGPVLVLLLCGWAQTDQC